jgi:hypothetical protein
MIIISSFSLTVRKYMVLDIMNDTTKYKDESQVRNDMIFEKVRCRKTVICPCCNHSFDPKNINQNNIKNKKSNNINDASCNTIVKVKSKKDGCNN